MAEKVNDSKDVVSENKDLLLQLVFKKLIGRGDESKARAMCSKILGKRRQKWRKRHKLSQEQGNAAVESPAAAIYHEHEEKYALTETASTLHNELTQKRKEGLKAARLLQAEKWDQNLDVIRYRLQQTEGSLQFLQTDKNSTITSAAANTSSSVHIDQHQLIKALGSAISQAKALKDIQGMKLYMTPRVPPIWSNGDQQDDYLLDTAKNPGDLTDSNNNSNIPVALTTEVSTTSLSQELVQDKPETLSMPVSFLPPETNLETSLHLSDAGPGGTDCTTATDSDTPSISIGMEVVCVEGLNGTTIGFSNDGVDTDVVVTSSGSSSLSPTGMSLSGPSQDGTVNGNSNVSVMSSGKRRKTRRTPVNKRQKLVKTPSSANPNSLSGKRRTRSSVLNTPVNSNSAGTETSKVEDVNEQEVTETDTDSDSQMCKILQVLERTPYELRVPKKNCGGLQRYSFNNNTMSLTGDRSKRKKHFTVVGKKT